MKKHAAKRTIYTDRFFSSEASIKTESPRKRAFSLLPEGNRNGCSFHMQGGKTTKELIMAAAVTAGIALCAAVWAQSEVIEGNTHANTASRRVRRRNGRCGT